jgi:Alternaria alternata allergen 1
MAPTHRSFIQVLLPLLLILTTLTSAFPLSRGQTASLNLTSCAPIPLLISQFSTFSGSATQYPHITFFLTNENAGAPGKMLCTAALDPGQGNFNGSNFYSCEKAGTGFNYQISAAGEEGRLVVFQYQVCEVEIVK